MFENLSDQHSFCLLQFEQAGRHWPSFSTVLWLTQIQANPPWFKMLCGPLLFENKKTSTELPEFLEIGQVFVFVCLFVYILFLLFFVWFGFWFWGLVFQPHQTCNSQSHHMVLSSLDWPCSSLPRMLSHLCWHLV